MAKEEKEIKKLIEKMNKKGKTINEIDQELVQGVGLSPEYSWEMIKKTLKLKEVV
jgi:hypothetical protein